MNGKFLRSEPWLYAGALILAIGFRLVNLGSLPLSDQEAAEALKALSLVNGSVAGSSQPLYALFTAGLFAIFDSTEFLARLLPALTGCMLLLLPWLLREKVGRLPAIILAYGLALDPALVAVSRQAGSAMPALTFSLLALAFYWKQQDRPAGVFAGLAVLSGTYFWFGLLGFILTYLADGIFNRIGNDKSDPITDEKSTRWRRLPGKGAWLTFGLTLLLGGSLFLMLPSGYNMIISGLLDHISGWQAIGGMTIQRILVALVTYQTAILLLGLTEGITGWIQGNDDHRMALIAFLAFLFLLFIYPNRQMQDAAWCVVFLWLLAAWVVGRFMDIDREVLLPVLGHAALVGALILFLILIAGWVLGGFGGLDVTYSLKLLGGLVVILIISFLVGYGWGVDVAVRGLSLGVGMVMAAIMLSLSISAGGVNGRSSPDLWRPDSRVIGAGVLQADLRTFSIWETGERNRIAIQVVNFDHPSIRWSLRKYPNTTYLEALVPGRDPEIIISDFSYRSELSSNYRGETFAWYTIADWNTLDVFSLIDWVFHRTAYEIPTNLMLWVRQDLFLSDSQSIIQ